MCSVFVTGSFRSFVYDVGWLVWLTATYYSLHGRTIGCVRAQFSMGSVYRFGEVVVEVDLAVAWKWWHLAALQGDVSSQRSLGVMSERGTGRPKDDHAAFQWYVRAAEQGDAEAQCYVGECYELGTGTDIDYEKAKIWYTKSAARNYGEAKARLDRLIP